MAQEKSRAVTELDALSGWQSGRETLTYCHSNYHDKANESMNKPSIR